jgi:hypothetical protein
MGLRDSIGSLYLPSAVIPPAHSPDTPRQASDPNP